MPNADVFHNRRQRLLQSIQPGVMVIFGAPVFPRNNDVEHPYRQSSDFYYLSGFEEPNSVLVLRSEGDPAFVMFVPDRDPEREVWDGPRAGVEGAKERYGADAAYPIAELDRELPRLLENVARVHYRLGEHRAHDDQLLQAISKVKRRGRGLVRWPTEIVDPLGSLHEQRLRKSPDEIDTMRRAAEITCEAHRLAMKAACPGAWEYEIEGVLQACFTRGGARRLAYASIVGSGPNATVLHYVNNDRQLQERDLLLIDAGCELDYYAADVTRTFPVSGRFSDAQRAIYEVVLAAQLEAIQATKPGVTLTEVHDAALGTLTQGLIDLKIIEGPLQVAIEEERYKPYFMHKTSHFLGMDVHDVGSYGGDGKARPLEPNMVVTIEPGIYIQTGADVDERYRGIGVRIEDDVLLTPGGNEVLTRAAPKTVQDVEQACRG